MQISNGDWKLESFQILTSLGKNYLKSFSDKMAR